MCEIYAQRWWDGRRPIPDVVNVTGEDFYGIGYDDSDRRIPDITKARTLLGWNPKYSIDEVIERSMEYWFEFSHAIQQPPSLAERQRSAQ